MQRYLGIEISDLDDCAPKFANELSEGFIVCLSQTGQGSQGHAMRPTGGVLHTESFDEGVEAIYGSWWESTIPCQCCSLEGYREDTTQNCLVIGVEVRLCQEGVQVLVQTCCPIIPLEVK